MSEDKKKKGHPFFAEDKSKKFKITTTKVPKAMQPKKKKDK